MARLIDAEPIVKFIEDGLNNPNKEEAFGHTAVQILTEIEYAPTVDAVEVVRWIPVTERLPEDMVDVLTCDGKGNIHIMWHHHEFMHPFNIGRRDLRYFPVTHWMPLPQPPKGETHNE